ncbi:MAG: hypothetical protein F6K21_23720 [Symploca sp. SIO2D2]|nr:hypothetical protein [Symploca sp. SIO2D2]
MTLPWSSSTYKQISVDRQSLLCHMPDSLQKSLVRAWEHHYEELYESEADGTVLLEEVLEEILHSFEGSNQTLNHIRYVWMALILACTVKPTVKYYQPNNPEPEEAINRLTDWLLVNIREIFYDRSPLIRASIGKVNNTSVNVCNLYSEKKISNFQGLSEALGVYTSAIKTLEANCAVAALLDILDDCLEGYAIFPGSYGRRELFNWWLWDVVPSTWYLFPPDSIYSLDKLNNEQNRLSLNRLKEISGKMWDIILPVTQGKKNPLAAQ